MKAEVIKCDRCGTIIDDTNGITVIGSIFVPGPDRGGLIGGPPMDGEPQSVDICAVHFLQAMTPEFRQELRKILERGDSNDYRF